MNDWRGSMVALVSPFRDGRLDFGTISDLVEWHIAEGTAVLCPAGCTGEAATFTHDEQIAVIQHVVKRVNGRIRVMGGSGSNSTREAIELTRRVKDTGADAALIICPYYNKPTQDGLARHYEAIAEATDFPIVLYNVPGRTGVNMLPATAIRLAKDPRIVAIKEASGSLDQVSEIINGSDLTVLSGDDSLTLPMLSVGAQGVISVAANVVPKLIATMVTSFIEGDAAAARAIHHRVFPLCKALFTESNPIPVKAALAMMGKIPAGVRLPLVELSEAGRPVVEQALRDLELL